MIIVIFLISAPSVRVVIVHLSLNFKFGVCISYYNTELSVCLQVPDFLYINLYQSTDSTERLVP